MSTPNPTVFQLPSIRLSDERSPIFLDVIRWMMAWKLDGHVEQLYIDNLHGAQEIANDTGAIIAPNHVSYWDSCLFFTLSELLSKRAFVFVKQDTLERLSFLRWCGAIPLNTNSSTQAHIQLKQGSRLCTDPTQLWIFPQGEHRPAHLSALRFKRGVTKLAEHTGLPIIPVAIQYLYKDGEKPIAYVSFRDPLPHHASVMDIEAEVKRGLQDIDAFHLGKDNDRFIAHYKRKVRERENLPTRILAWFALWRLNK